MPAQIFRSPDRLRPANGCTAPIGAGGGREHPGFIFPEARPGKTIHLKRGRKRSVRRTKRSILGPLACAIVLLAGVRTRAQEALRSSLSYDRAVEVNQNPAVNLEPDRPHLGPVQLSLGGYAEADFQDNITYVQTDPLADEILHTGVNVGFYWPVTLQSDLSLNTSIGYAHYLKYSQYDYLEIGPNSALSWNVLFEDGSLTFFDQFTYSQQVVSQAALSGVATFPIFENTAGVRVNWLPNQWAFQAGYSHDDYLSDSSTFEYLDRSSEYLFARGAWRFAENTQAGMETSASYTSYRTSSQNDNYSFSVGPYTEWQITRAIHATLRGGPTFYLFPYNGSASQGTGVGSYYLGVQVSQQLTDFVSHQLNIQRNVSLGVNQGSQYIEEFNANYSASWAMTRHISLGVGGSYVHGTQVFQNLVTLAPGFGFLLNQTEVYDLYSVGPSATWQATDKLSTSLGYTYYFRKSDLPDRGYTLNSISLRVNYNF
jgi:hypothetical protein